jgi:hypothetical protein
VYILVIIYRDNIWIYHEYLKMRVTGMETAIFCFGLDLECPPKAHSNEPLFPVQQFSEVRLFGRDGIMRALTSSMV